MKLRMGGGNDAPAFDILDVLFLEPNRVLKDLHFRFLFLNMFASVGDPNRPLINITSFIFI